MKISPVASGANTVGAVSGGVDHQAQRIQGVRSIKMAVNATPGDARPAQELSIPDPSSEATGVVEATEPLSPQFAALAKQKRALQVKERELADREKALSAQAPTQGNAVDLARLKSEPLSVLLEAGVTYDQLTEAILANQSGDSKAVLEAKLKALEESFEKKLTDRDQQTVQQYLNRETKVAEKLIAEGDDFEIVRELGLVSDVPKLIKAVYEAEGIALTAKEALEELETVGLEKVNEDAAKLARIKKVQASQVPPTAPMQPPSRQMKTLTNRDTATVPLTPKQRALAAFYNQLKK